MRDNMNESLLIVVFNFLFQLQATEVIHPPKTQPEASAQILQTTITTTTAISFNPSHRRHLYSYKHRRRHRPNSHIIY